MKIQIGDLAPEFDWYDAKGNKTSLRDFRGHKLVLFFYPKDFTLFCTREACNLRDNYSLLEKEGYKVVGISADDSHSHKQFKEKYKLPYELVSDTGRNIISMYGAWGRRTFYAGLLKGVLRKTFLIDKDGRIEAIINNVKSGSHAQQILNYIKSLKS